MDKDLIFSKINDYIDNECMKYDLSLYTPLKKIEEYYSAITGLDNDTSLTVHEKRDYLYNYVLDDLVENNKITPKQKEDYLIYITVLEKYRENSLDNMIEILCVGNYKRKTVMLLRKINSCYEEYAVAINYTIKGNSVKWSASHFYDNFDEAKKDFEYAVSGKKFSKDFFTREQER